MTTPRIVPFASRLRPAPRAGGFRDADWWTWCGSVVADDDGRTHLFASRWPRSTPFFNGYLFGSRIVHAVADDPLGPFEYRGDLFGGDEPGRWDGRMTHNPAVVRFGQRWWLFYIGLSYDGPAPGAEVLAQPPWPTFRWLYRRIRIGAAWADALEGPWQRCDEPVIDTDVAPWEHLVTTNPAPVVTPQGRVRVYYRTPRQEGDRVRNVLAVAEADHPAGPYRPLLDRPLFAPDVHLEDPHVWWAGGHYEALAKDLDGNTAGQRGALVHLWSPDGVDWRPVEADGVERRVHESACVLRNVRFDDGQVVELGNLERPWLLHDAAGPRVLYCAASDDPRGFHHAQSTWNQPIPLA